MSCWKITTFGKTPVLRNPILIEGLPGIGNVGKVAVDFLVDELEAKKINSFTTHTFPHSVFVNEQNLVELPLIELYYKKMDGRDLLLLVGDVQPIDEVSCYEFCEEVLKLLSAYHGNEIITIGGIGLQDIPKNPKVYVTGNSKRLIAKYKADTELISKLYGVVGPIVGVSGLLVGLAAKSKVDAVCLLAETFGHPMYLGIKGAREILKVLNGKLSLNIKFNELDKEIAEIEKGLSKSGDISAILKQQTLKKLKAQLGEDVSYIG